jgi:hypothetical protein
MHQRIATGESLRRINIKVTFILDSDLILSDFQNYILPLRIPPEKSELQDRVILIYILVLAGLIH